MSDVIKTAIVWVNLGTPDAPTASAVRRYLKEFLSDPRVVEIPRIIWWPLLNGIILPFRAKQSAKKYASVWEKEGSPLRIHTEKQATLLQRLLTARGHQVKVVHAMRYGQPAVSDVLSRLAEEGIEQILILPAYPQYSGTTTASVWDAVFAHYRGVRAIPELRCVRGYADHEGYIAALKAQVLAHWEQEGPLTEQARLVMSFHGIPQRVIALGDPYQQQCYRTATSLAEQLGLHKDQYVVTFQSRFGKAAWLQPYTEPTLVQLARDGVNRVDILCPGFTGDCLETLEEIGMEAKACFLEAGGRDFHFIPCLNESPAWMDALVEIAEQHIMGWSTLPVHVVHAAHE